MIIITKHFSQDIKFVFGTGRCKIRRKEKENGDKRNIEKNTNDEILGIHITETNKFLGNNQHTQLNINNITNNLRSSFQ